MDDAPIGTRGEDVPLDTSSAAVEQPVELSKNAKKKLARDERYAAFKLERRAKEKEKKREKKKVLQAKRAAGELDDADEEESNRSAKKSKMSQVDFGGRIILDLGFDDLMNDKEVKSLCSQLAYTYSVNRNASFPFRLLYTSLSGRAYTRLESMSDASYKRWSNTEWWQDSYEKLWLDTNSTGSSTISTSAEVPAPTTNTTDGSGAAAISNESAPGIQNEGASTSATRQSMQESIVYLTADADEELTELKPEETYIIGGICDHNRYKNLCLDKAQKSGIRAARLPIGRYLASLPTRKVLTVNQVMEILIRWAETRDWRESFEAVIPKRKFVVGKGKGKGQADSRDDAEEDEDEEAEICPPEDSKVVIVPI